MTDERSFVAHLRRRATSVVVASSGGMPEVLWWGHDLGDGEIDLAQFERPVPGGGLDHDPPFAIGAEAARGWAGRPGLEGSRPDGSAGQPVFGLTNCEIGEHHVDAALVDLHAALELTLGIALDEHGVLRVDVSVSNTGDSDYRLDALRVGIPVGDHAAEVLTFGGRHNNEFGIHRSSWGRQTVTVENRRGRPAHERAPSMIVGSPGFGEEQGDVWAVHLAWSGDVDIAADGVTDGRRVVQVGELLRSGELTLGPRECFEGPTVLAAFSSFGLSGISDAFHGHIRARKAHPKFPRPVHLNTWEAVYFDHDVDRLRALADRAAQVGVERFVLDDGWFGSRRDDASGLGDWVVSSDVWPDGLDPIVDHVRSLGMGFGLWFEPEMVNLDSDLYRQHPDWVLGDARYEQPLGRHQLVLDLGRSDVRDHLFEQIDALLTRYDIEYVKWDHNRDLVQAASGGGSGVHLQTLGVYELIDRIRAAHPDVEIETCASGGGRADLGILARTDRVWTSDTMDAIDRIAIQRGFSVLFPPELMGSHIGAPIAHTTLRRHRHGFRAAAAMFGSFGIEWDLLRLDDDGLSTVARLVDLHKRHRELLHTGRTRRIDHPDPSLVAQGVISVDRCKALFAVFAIASSHSHHRGALRLPGLDPGQRYRVTLVGDIDEPLGWARWQPSWVADGVEATGRQLERAGLRLPVLHPESALLIEVVTVP
ncbi:MAG: alpha-galactosidase [Ilumatobacteraceae bacterium]